MLDHPTQQQNPNQLLYNSVKRKFSKTKIEFSTIATQNQIYNNLDKVYLYDIRIVITQQ